VNNKTYDVKTMGRTSYPKDYYVNNLIGMQAKYDVDRYIFCSLHKKDKVLTICGWIDKDEFINKARFFGTGVERTRSDGTKLITKCDLYELENRELVQSNTIEEFVHQINS
jgi:thioredoxin-related protein